MFKSSQANGIFITKSVAQVLNRKMKAAGYPTTISKIKGYYGMNIIERFGGASTTDCNQIASLIVDAYDDVHPEEAYNRRMEDRYYGNQ